MVHKYTLLEAVWAEQKAYNVKVRTRRPLTYEAWMEKYLLGAISEVDEVLNEMNWKAHRLGRSLDRNNLARELADLTKYVFSLWEWSGFSSDDMLRYVHEKSVEMEAQWNQDFRISYPDGCPIIISDIDGTLADYRKGFVDWIKGTSQPIPSKDRSTSLMMEIDMGVTYPVYMRLKEEFEASGGYQNLPLYADVPLAVKELSDMGISFIAYTARPHKSYTRIWLDSWAWVRTNQLDPYIQELRIGKEERIARACALVEKGHRVVLLEDDPSTAIRAAATGIPVFLRDQPYNRGVDANNIIRFSKIPVMTMLAHLEAE